MAMTEVEEILPQENCWFSNHLRWSPTSMAALAKAESRLLAYVKTSFRTFFVNIGNKIGNEENLVRTIALNEKSENIPVVLVHGFASGIGLWALNLDSLAANRPVYAFDLLGFGRSSRVHFDHDFVEVENQFVQSIEDWREKVKLNKIVLMGHSFGGYLASAYALKHPDRVQHLVLADPWGFAEADPEAMNSRLQRVPVWGRALFTILQPFNPLAGMRAAGPLGPYLVNRLRSDIKLKFATALEPDNLDLVTDYIYHCNAQTPSGETAFKTLTMKFGWAKRPMVSRITELPDNLAITFVFGEKSWIDKQPGYQIKDNRPNSRVNIKIIADSGHHVYADVSEEFNKILNKVCKKEDEKFRGTNLNTMKQEIL